MAPLQAKVVLLGDSGVGKTCLRQRYLNNTFTNQFKASIGADFVFKKVTGLQGTPDEIDINMQILDAAGQERFRSLAQAFYRGADACILCFPVSEPNSLASLQSWFNDFVERVDLECRLEDICFVAVGTKNDLDSALSVDQVIQQLDQLLPGARLAPQSQQQTPNFNVAQDSNSSAPSKPQPQPVQASTRSQRSAQNASLLSRTRKISSTSSNFSNSIYHTPASSMASSIPDSIQSSSLSTIRARRSSDDDDNSEDNTPSATPKNTQFGFDAIPITEEPDAGQSGSPGEETQVEAGAGPDGISTAFTLFYTSAKTGQAVSDPFTYIADQLGLRLKEKRADQEWSRVDEDELEEVGMTFTLRNVTSRNHIMLDHTDDPILPLKPKPKDNKTGMLCC